MEIGKARANGLDLISEAVNLEALIVGSRCFAGKGEQDRFAILAEAAVSGPIILLEDHKARQHYRFIRYPLCEVRYAMTQMHDISDLF